MNDYILVPVELLKDWHERINTIAAETAFSVADEIESMLATPPAVQGEPIGWYTEDHLDDKSATTYNAEIAQRWRDKGWPVWSLYAAPQPAEQQPACASQSVKSDSQAALSAESERQAPDVPGLTKALRQYQHNDGSGLVFGYDKLLVDQYVEALVEALSALRGCIMETRGPDAHSALVLADAALAAHRKGEKS